MQMAAQPQRASLGPDPATDPDQPVYHVAPRQGWANDGIGFIYHKGRYHMCVIAYELHAAAVTVWGRATRVLMPQTKYTYLIGNAACCRTARFCKAHRTVIPCGIILSVA